MEWEYFIIENPPKHSETSFPEFEIISKFSNFRLKHLITSLKWVHEYEKLVTPERKAFVYTVIEFYFGLLLKLN